MLDEFLKNAELARITFARILNQNGVNTGVDTEKLFKKYLEDNNMEDIPINIRQLEEKHMKDEPEEILDELEERELTKEELDKIVEKVNSDLSDPKKATEIVKEAFETLLDEYSEHPKGDEPEIRLAEPDYYAGNGLSPLEAFKQGLLSREGTIGFIKGNVIKYTVRAGHKHNASEDIVKAIDYLMHLKELYEKEMRCKDNNTILQESKSLFHEALAGLDNIKDVETRDPYAPNPKGKRG